MKAETILQQLLHKKAMELATELLQQLKSAPADDSSSDQILQSLLPSVTPQENSKASQSLSEPLKGITVKTILMALKEINKPANSRVILARMGLPHKQPHTSSLSSRLNYLVGKGEIIRSPKVTGQTYRYSIPGAAPNPIPPKPHPQPQPEPKEAKPEPTPKTITDPTQKAVWIYIKNNPDQKLIKIMRGTKIKDYGTIYKTLEALVQNGEIIRQRDKSYVIS